MASSASNSRLGVGIALGAGALSFILALCICMLPGVGAGYPLVNTGDKLPLNVFKMIDISEKYVKTLPMGARNNNIFDDKIIPELRCCASFAIFAIIFYLVGTLASFSSIRSYTVPVVSTRILTVGMFVLGSGSALCAFTALYLAIKELNDGILNVEDNNLRIQVGAAGPAGILAMISGWIALVGAIMMPQTAQAVVIHQQNSVIVELPTVADAQVHGHNEVPGPPMYSPVNHHQSGSGVFQQGGPQHTIIVSK